jgi:hypothetical protein
MINKSKLIGIAAIVAVGFASPAFAQRTYDPGLNAFAAVPSDAGGGNFSPLANGGGSVGYNSDIGMKTD